MSGNRTTDRLRKTSAPDYFQLMLCNEQAIVKFCSRDVSELLPLILQPPKKWKRKCEETEEICFLPNHRKMFTLPFSLCKANHIRNILVRW